jgi:hypothetical protein
VGTPLPASPAAKSIVNSSGFQNKCDASNEANFISSTLAVTSVPEEAVASVLSAHLRRLLFAPEGDLTERIL